MKTLIRVLLVLLVIAAIAFGVWYFVLNRPVDLQARPPGSDGALAWAYGLALTPARTALAPDALLVEAEASDMMPDGRLAANRGEWRLAFSSFTTPTLSSPRYAVGIAPRCLTSHGNLCLYIIR